MGTLRQTKKLTFRSNWYWNIAIDYHSILKYVFLSSRKKRIESKIGLWQLTNKFLPISINYLEDKDEWNWKMSNLNLTLNFFLYWRMMEKFIAFPYPLITEEIQFTYWAMSINKTGSLASHWLLVLITDNSFIPRSVHFPFFWIITPLPS